MKTWGSILLQPSPLALAVVTRVFYNFESITDVSCHVRQSIRGGKSPAAVTTVIGLLPRSYTTRVSSVLAFTSFSLKQ